jgi:hypothetical protein
MTELKLIALDEEDLAVVSSLLQDAVVRAADMTYLPQQKRFAAIVNRFDWERAEKASGGMDYRRRRTALRFDRVFGRSASSSSSRLQVRFFAAMRHASERRATGAAHAGRRRRASRSRSPRGTSRRRR